MKKYFLTLILCLASICSWADDSGTCGENVTWSYNSSKKALGIMGTGDMENYSYLSSVPWNAYKDEIKLLLIEDGVTSIGSNAFNNLKNVTKVTIPNSVTSIWESSFYGCTGLKSITIPSSVTSIALGAFAECSGLTSISVDESNTVYNSFNNCNAIITNIGNTLICGCKNTVIPNSVTTIAYEAFQGCTGLTSIVIPSSVTTIAQAAFQNCSNLTSITIPNSVTTINRFAFAYCSSLKSVELSNSLNKLENSLFIKCIELESIVIPNSVTSIEENVFYNCTGLQSVTIGNGVTEITRNAFYGCSSLTSIDIPNNVTSIGNSAFYNCTGLKSVTIGNGVTSIGNYAFVGCTGLMSIEIPNNVTSIGSSAFYNCTGLKSVTIGNGVTTIELSTFNGCTGLTSVTIGNSVNSIGEYAFKDCFRLSRIEVLATEPPYLASDNVFAYSNESRPDEIYKYTYVHVPKGTFEDYSGAYGWRYFERFKEDMSMDGTPYYVRLRVNEANKGYVDQYVKVDDSYTVAFGKKSKAIKKVEFNGEEVTEQVKDNSYMTPVLKEDSEIKVEYDEVEGDMNGDGVVSVTDVGILITNILKGN